MRETLKYIRNSIEVGFFTPHEITKRIDEALKRPDPDKAIELAFKAGIGQESHELLRGYLKLKEGGK